MQTFRYAARILHKKSHRWGATWEAQREMMRERIFGVSQDPGPEKAVEACLEWLLQAQEKSASGDGGVARHYSLVSGWGASYPETTGYIIPTILDHAHRRQCSRLKAAAARMLEWLVSIQMPNGAFRGSHMHSPVEAPVVFDTGQILIGLSVGMKNFGLSYEDPVKRASRWLIEVQDADGAWRHPNPFVAGGDHVWETHVAWGLLEASRSTGVAAYGEAGLRNMRWAVSRQLPNGWYQDCGMGDDNDNPLTHTLAYTLRGILEGYRFSGDPALLAAAVQTADGLLSARDKDGALPGQLDKNWKGTVRWICLTGLSQTAICWLMLYQDTGREDYLNAAFTANRYVRSTLRLEGPSELRGGVKGSLPVNGEYCRFQFINWACKFLIDACTLEMDIRAARSALPRG
ncbi:hypothetical protein WJU23_09070 [Prosthecobacter sp. SYSU 5D2]|uniref:hypothetical protein n=1 Tax=Prosthecobacter sp. SYSU 5D2 TaxID=3134134 RepID=UPI0031FEBC1A